MRTVIPVANPEDPVLDFYRNVRERDLCASDHFIAEGEVVLRVLLSSSACAPLSLLVAEKRLDHILSVVGSLPNNVPIYTASQPVIDSVVGFHVHRGILAVGRRIQVPSISDLLADAPSSALIVVLFGIANHDNIGGIFRNAAAFGAHAVLLDAQCCDPLYRKSIRVSVGASLIVPFARFNAQSDPIATLEQCNFEPIGLSPRGAIPLAMFRRGARAALLLGTEGPGLPETILDRVKTVVIPMARGFDSLNVATTSGIVLHHLSQT